jgi:thiamine-monophosphate kinase
MHEFDLIRTLFAPLTEGFPGSLNLADDAALLDVPDGMQLAATKDAIVAGVHFLGGEGPALIARKLLRVNLSDLAAMGAQPWCYFLACALPGETPPAWVKEFADGLREDQEAFGLHLAGGDTTATPGPLTLSLTALGLVPRGQVLKRGGAKAGDLIYVSGTLGDGAMGLQLLRDGREDAYFTRRYLLPEPRLSLGLNLRGVASACMDISDGLVQDLGHLCNASGCGAEITAAHVPRRGGVPLELALTGGDDYELLFTAPASIALENVTCIGRMVEDEGVRVLDERGEIMRFAREGYRHF